MRASAFERCVERMVSDEVEQDRFSGSRKFRHSAFGKLNVTHATLVAG